MRKRFGGLSKNINYRRVVHIKNINYRGGGGGGGGGGRLPVDGLENF